MLAGGNEMIRKLLICGTMIMATVCTACSLNNSSASEDDSTAGNTTEITSAYINETNTTGEIETTKFNAYEDLINKLDIPDTIKLVFTDNEKFVDTKSTLLVDIDNYLNLGDVSYFELFWKQFAVVDLDRDGTNEMIFQAAKAEDAEPYNVIFHEKDGKVYAYQQNYRSMVTVTTDGFILGSSGAADNDIYTITFEGNKLVEHSVAKMSSALGMDNLQFTVGNKPVSEADYNVFLDSFNSKATITWVTLDNKKN